MLDLKFIRDNLDLVKRSIKARGLVLDIDKLIYLDDKRKKLITKIGELNAKRNENSSKMQENLDKVLKISLIETGKILKKQLIDLEEELERVSVDFDLENKKVPNILSPDVPIGSSEEDNFEIKRVGVVPQFDFKPKDHLELGRDLDLLDFDRAREISGSKFYYLKNEAVF